MARIATASLVAAACLLGSVGAHASDEEHEWRKENGEAHGSQVSSSEWLPIIIGGSAGLIVGGVVGSAFDDHQPPVAGGIAGAAVGAIAGGAGGAWIIRTIREKDTRTPAMLTGLAVGAGVGLIMWNQIGDPEGRALETVGKWSSLVVFPAVGAVVGYKLGTVWGGAASQDKPTTGVIPVVAPIAGAHGNGLTIGATAIF